MTWEVVVYFTRGHVCVIDSPTRESAAELAAKIARDGFIDFNHQSITPVTHIGSVTWGEKKEQTA